MHRPANTQIISTFTTVFTLQMIACKQRQSDKRKTIEELINTNEPCCVCVDAHPRFFDGFTRFAYVHFLHILGSLISELHCKLNEEDYTQLT